MRTTLLLLFLSVTAFAQIEKYPQKYFRNPLNIPIFLAGNFGENRPGHFHSGIDIKTKGKENLPVFAAAEGYISRVKMEPGGFGHGIYITHPNGYTTLYAHLNNFFPALQKLVHETQYQNKNWELDLTFTPEKFPIKKGEQIAWSGNTGGSSAPHLHFEIRDTKTEHPLNPQLFGFEIIDNISPVPTEIVLYDANKSVYNQTVQRIKLKKNGSFYSPLKDTINTNCSTINIGIAVNDFMNNSTNTLSFYTAKWYANDVLIGTITLDDIGYDETRYLHACSDYKLKKETGIWYNSLFLLPNNKLERIYNFQGNRGGYILLNAIYETTIKILIEDVLGNKTEIKFIAINGQSSKELCDTKWKAGMENNFENPNLKFTLPATALYDDVCFEATKKYEANSPSSRWSISKASIPVHNYFELSIKPEVAIPFSLANKIALMYSDGKDKSGKAAQPKDGWYSATVRAFGDYWLAIDTTAPSIKTTLKNGANIAAAKQIRFMVSDDMTSVKTLEGHINNEWVCFERHGKNWFYTIDEHCPKGKIKLDIIAKDENDNTITMSLSLTR